MLMPLEVRSNELPALIARLRAEGKRASSITALSTGGYRVVVAGPKPALEAQQLASVAERYPTIAPQKILNADELAGLCARLQAKGTQIASIRHVGAGGFTITVVSHDCLHRPRHCAKETDSLEL